MNPDPRLLLLEEEKLPAMKLLFPIFASLMLQWQVNTGNVNPGSKREWLEEAEIWQSLITETQRDTENEMPKDTAEKFILHQSFTIRHIVPQAPNPDCV